MYVINSYLLLVTCIYIGYTTRPTTGMLSSPVSGSASGMVSGSDSSTHLDN